MEPAVLPGMEDCSWPLDECLIRSLPPEDMLFHRRSGLHFRLLSLHCKLCVGVASMNVSPFVEVLWDYKDNRWPPEPGIQGVPPREQS